MNQANKCPECGAELPASAPRGLCPACLLKRGLETNTIGYTEPPAAGWTPPTVEELAGRFPELEILRLIGRGGMGAVYQARQKNLDRVVALKILPPQMSHDRAFAERFTREAQAMARLNHPHIVTIHEFGEREGLYYFVMEYVDGVSLRGLLDAGHITPKEALAIVPQICEALQYAHDQGIVHRDIKPENILLNKHGQVKIADFGLAKLMGQSPISNLKSQIKDSVMGTPQYMAPEQLERPSEVDHRADIYSLGVVFYQMLTGELPKGAFAPPSRKVQIDVRLDEIVLRAMEKEPERRYQQASEVKTEVETISQMPGPVNVVHPSAFGWEYRSRRTLWGLPLIHVAMGIDPTTGKGRAAQGIIAVGQTAKGVIAMGGRAYGIIAFGGFAAGLLALGGFSVGLLSFGGFAFALLYAYGGLAIAPVAFGGLALGYYCFGGYAMGVHALGGNANDPYARELFASLRPNWLTTLFFVLFGGVMCLYGTLILLGGRWSSKAVRGGGERSGSRNASQIERARQAVKAPAIGLAFAAGISLAVLFALMAVVVVFHRIPGVDIQPWVLALLILGLSPNIFVFFAALGMMSLKGRAAAIVAGILALFLSPGNIIGLPVGIWTLVVLSRHEVIEAFQASERDKAMVKTRTALLIGIVLALGVMLSGAGAIIYAQGQQNVQLLKGWANAADQQNRPAPQVVKTTPAAFANDVDPSLDKITVTFDRPMMDKSWSFTAGDKAFSERTGSLVPERTGEISYDAARITCAMPVKLQPGKVYWVGVNSPQHQNFKSENGEPAPPYQILFATRSADGKPTPLPEELLKQAKEINATSHQRPRIGIYLITGRPNGVPPAKVLLADFTLADEPLIGEDDIFEYDWESHTIRLKSQVAADRILKRKGVGDADMFVVMANGERLYAGVMRSAISSLLPQAPIINVGPTAGQFQPQMAVRIYWPPIQNTPDPRSDTRLKQALQALHLLARPDGNGGVSTRPARRDEPTIEDVASRMLVAIRDQDDVVLKGLAADRIRGWRDALPIFAREMRQQFQRITGKPFDMHVSDSRIDGDWAVVRCDGPAELKGACLILSFVKTPDGWRNCQLHNAPPGMSPEKRLQALIASPVVQFPRKAIAFVEQLAKGDFEAATRTFDEPMLQAMPAAKLAEVWKQLGDAGGKYIGHSDTPQIKSIGEYTAEYTAVYVPCVWEKNAVDLKVVYHTDRGTITGLWVVKPGDD